MKPQWKVSAWPPSWWRTFSWYPTLWPMYFPHINTCLSSASDHLWSSALTINQLKAILPWPKSVPKSVKHLFFLLEYVWFHLGILCTKTKQGSGDVFPAHLFNLIFATNINAVPNELSSVRFESTGSDLKLRLSELSSHESQESQVCRLAHRRFPLGSHWVAVLPLPCCSYRNADASRCPI